MTDYFSPTIKTEYGDITPTGFEWVIAFALNGCKWAIDEVNKPKYKELL